MANRVAPLTNIETLTGNISAQTYFDNNISPVFSATNDSSLGFVNVIGSDTGSANNYIVLCPFGSPSAYNIGMFIAFPPANTNTAASTVTVSPLTSVSIKRSDGTALSGGELVAGVIVAMIFDGTQFRIVSPTVPAGTVSIYAGGTVPPAYKLCNGAAISRTIFAPLFTAIGTAYGAGDGSTTFNLPNMANGTYPQANSTLGTSGGSTAIAVANLPAHNHVVNITDPQHNHSLNFTLTTANAGANVSVVNTVGQGGSNSGNTNNAATGISATTNNTGSGTAYNPPFLTFNFIIKT